MGNTHNNWSINVQGGILAVVLLLALLDGFVFQVRSPQRGISWELGITMPAQPEWNIGMW